jgi:hypothetical protein
MKFKITYILFALICLSMVFSSYRNGAALHGGWDCSGGESGFTSPTGCNSGGGCHASSATAGIRVVLELDSAGIPVTGYWPGQAYTVKLTGTNTTASALPGFGFQVTATAGTTELATPTTVGTWGTAPASTHVAAPSAGNYVLSVFEQGSVLSPASGTGATGSIYRDSISWTAPVAGTGSISLWAALNAVNNNGGADAGDLWNVAHIVITEDTVATTNTGVATVSQTDGLSVYPNPVNDILYLQWINTQSGTYTVSVYNTVGQLMQTLANPHSISTTDWPSGVYLLNIQKDGANQVFRILKQ